MCVEIVIGSRVKQLLGIFVDSRYWRSDNGLICKIFYRLLVNVNILNYETQSNLRSCEKHESVLNTIILYVILYFDNAFIITSFSILSNASFSIYADWSILIYCLFLSKVTNELFGHNPKILPNSFRINLAQFDIQNLKIIQKHKWKSVNKQK